MRELFALSKAAWRFRDYRPQQVTVRQARAWIRQFEKRDRRSVCQLLPHITYFSERTTRKLLVDLNDSLLKRLKAAGLQPRKVIYVQIHDAGSSSPVMVNLVRDGGRLQSLGCKFVDSKDILGLSKLTNELTEGAIVYVDDFLGTGDQFCEVRNDMAQYIVGNFAEFLLAPCICEEAYARLLKDGVEVQTSKVHLKVERPLHADSVLLKPQVKARLLELCSRVQTKNALGYKDIASMVVFYRNAPDTFPKIFRGNQDQKPLIGIIPRISDLPKRAVQ